MHAASPRPSLSAPPAAEVTWLAWDAEHPIVKVEVRAQHAFTARELAARELRCPKDRVRFTPKGGHV